MEGNKKVSKSKVVNKKGGTSKVKKIKDERVQKSVSVEKSNSKKSATIERKRFLPIGSVVLLKDAQKKLMVTGFCVTDQNEKKSKMWDYCGCLYPEGIISPDQIFLFDHKQIEKLYFIGFENNHEEKLFKNKLITAYKDQRKRK